MRRPALIGLIATCVSLALLTSSCSSVPSHSAARYKKGPPLHANPRGTSHRYRFVYYPSSYVYFDSSQRAYFFIKDGRWTTALTLPRSVTVDRSEAVFIEMKTNKPYLHFDAHREKYPPRHLKKRKKK
jgi:hypothetical protein